MNQIRLQHYKLMAANKTISESERANYLRLIKEMEGDKTQRQSKAPESAA